MSDENVWPGDTCRIQQGMQFLRNLPCRARLRSRIAPALSGTVITYRTRELRHFPLHMGPAQARRSHARFEDHRRCALPDYMDVHPSLVEADEASRRRKTPTVPQCSNDLVYGAAHQHDRACAEEKRKNHKGCMVSIRLTPVGSLTPPRCRHMPKRRDRPIGHCRRTSLSGSFSWIRRARQARAPCTLPHL